MPLLCIAGGGAVVRLALAGFTLAWTHTIEKIPWEEDWRLQADRLVLEEVRIKGSGAGMEPAPDARLEDGFYVWNPRETRRQIVLRRADVALVGDWRFCRAGTCEALGDIVGATADPVTISPCE